METYLKIYFRILLITFLTLNMSCKNESKTATEKQEKEPLTSQVVENKKFVYAIAIAKQPRLNVERTGGYYDGNYYVTEKTNCFVDWYIEVYSSEIIEVSDYNEDFKYKLMDKFEKDVKGKLYYKDESFKSEILIKCQLDENKDDLSRNKSKIEKTTIKVFDSYSDASKHLRNVSSKLN